MLVEKHSHEPQLKQHELAEWCRVAFHLAKAPAQATISNILHRFDPQLAASIPDDRKTNHSVAFPALDQALRQWMLAQQANRAPISDDHIQAKARELFEELQQSGVIAKDESSSSTQPLKFSNGWLAAFKRRHGFTRSHRNPSAI